MRRRGLDLDARADLRPRRPGTPEELARIAEQIDNVRKLLVLPGIGARALASGRRLLARLELQHRQASPPAPPPEPPTS